MHLKRPFPTQHYMECSEVPNAASYGCLCIHGVRLLLCSMRRCPASRLQTRCFSWKISAQLRSDPWRIRCLLERLLFSLAFLAEISSCMPIHLDAELLRNRGESVGPRMVIGRQVHRSLSLRSRNCKSPSVRSARRDDGSKQSRDASPKSNHSRRA